MYSVLNLTKTQIKGLIPKNKDIPAVVKKHNLEVLLQSLKDNVKYYRGFPTKKTIEHVDLVSKVILAALGYRFDLFDTCVVYIETEGFTCGVSWLKRYISPNNYQGFGDVENDVLPVVSYVFNYIGIEIGELQEFAHEDYCIDLHFKTN